MIAKSIFLITIAAHPYFFIIRVKGFIGQFLKSFFNIESPLITNKLEFSNFSIAFLSPPPVSSLFFSKVTIIFGSFSGFKIFNKFFYS